jgi:hypothetical protein
MQEKLIPALILLFTGMILCHGQSPIEIKLLESKQLPEFPSCSAVNYRDGRLYLIGDDAPHILELDRHYNIIKSIQIADHADKRIPKKTKQDLECATFIVDGTNISLLVMGSSATEQRELIRIIPFDKGLDIKREVTINIGPFVGTVRSRISEINFEGVEHVGKYFVLSNRGNASHSFNHFILTPGPFWTEQSIASPNVIQVDLPIQSENVIGISDLCYDVKSDRLFISFSTELTANAYDDGAIGDSYLGYIEEFSKQLQSDRIKVDCMINLSQVDARFQNQKIEGLCIEHFARKRYIFHLTSDDDKGSSAIFKVSMKF